MQNGTKRFQAVEINVANNVVAGSKIFIKDQPQLRTQTDQLVIIEAIETYDIDALALSPAGVTMPTTAQLANVVLTLNVAGYENLQYIPLTKLLTQGSSDTSVQRLWNVEGKFCFDNLWQVDWTKSYLQFGAAQNAGISFVLGVYYRVSPNDNRGFPQPYNQYQG